jgi:hypothetical protein
VNLKHLTWLLLVTGVVIYYVETSKGQFLFTWESSLPGSQTLGLGIGEYLGAAAIGLLIYQR